MRNKKISTITKFLKNEILDQELARFTFFAIHVFKMGLDLDKAKKF